MPSIVSSKLRVRNAFGFVLSIGANTYMFIGKTTPWTEPGFGEYNPPVPTDKDVSHTDHWKTMIGMKNVGSSSVKMAIKRYNWDGASSFEAYSSTDPDLYRKKFYCYAVDNSGVGRVYKCLTKGSGNSTEKPTGTNSAPFTLSDGYKWKFMYEITADDAETFNTPQYIPVTSSGSLTNVWRDAQVADSEYPTTTSFDGSVVVGHGGNNAQELGGFYVIVNCKFDGSEGGKLTVQNDYRKIGLIDAVGLVAGGLATSSFYDTTTKLTLSGAPGTNFLVDQEVQVNGTTATVVDVGTDFIKINNYSGTIIPGVSVSYGSTSATVSSVVVPLVRNNSGHILFVEQRSPISRSENQVESLNIVLEF